MFLLHRRAAGTSGGTQTSTLVFGNGHGLEPDPPAEDPARPYVLVCCCVARAIQTAMPQTIRPAMKPSGTLAPRAPKSRTGT